MTAALLSLWAFSAAAPLVVSGRVADAAGGAVADALARLTCRGAIAGEARTGSDGTFSLSLAADHRCLQQPGLPVVSLTVEAAGFAPARRVLELSAAFEPISLDIILLPVGPAEMITVTATGRALRGRDSPASTSVVTDADLAALAALGVDDVLRLTPGFTLFRRSSSRSANPTTHGVTLRGLSASGASRSLVLLDGVPLNDPFGGWVYWSRVPQAAIERIEVARGGASDLYGADAVGGVVQVRTFETRRQTLRALVEGGSLETGRASSFAGGRLAEWTIAGAGEWFNTRGSVPVAAEARGPVDTPAGSSHGSFAVDVGLPRVRATQLSLRGGLFSEDRTNGTPLQVNDTNERQLTFNIAGGRASQWRVRGFAQRQGYDQSFSAVAEDRASERLTSEQRVPSRAGGASAEWSRASSTQAWVVGVDARTTRGTVEERRPLGQTLQVTTSGGRQQVFAVFGQVTRGFGSSVQTMVGGRVDALSTRIDARDALIEHTFFSPRVSIAWRLASAVTVRGAAYRSFRAPTLNERLRGFRAGDVVTLANPSLAPEALAGGEVAVVWALPRGSVQATGFLTSLDDVIANVTVSSTPTLITRERRNAGRLRASGVELEAGWQLVPGLSARVAAAFTRAIFATSPEGLAGNHVPQVPGRQLALDVRYAHRRGLLLSAQIRYISSQWEDDRNTLRLAPATVIDALAAQQIARHVRLFVAAENLADADYDVGRTPIRIVGTPRTVRAGLGFEWP